MPPPPPRFSRGLASLTFNARPPTSWPLNFSMAAAPSSLVDISMKPKPRERPVSRSSIRDMLSTVPVCANIVCSSVLDVSNTGSIQMLSSSGAWSSIVSRVPQARRAERAHCRWPGQCRNPPRRNKDEWCRRQGQSCSHTERLHCLRPRVFHRVPAAQRPTHRRALSKAPVALNQIAPVPADRSIPLLSGALRGKSLASPAEFRAEEVTARSYSRPTSPHAVPPSSACGYPNGVDPVNMRSRYELEDR